MEDNLALPWQSDQLTVIGGDIQPFEANCAARRRLQSDDDAPERALAAAAFADEPKRRASPARQIEAVEGGENSVSGKFVVARQADGFDQLLGHAALQHETKWPGATSCILLNNPANDQPTRRLAAQNRSLPSRERGEPL